jgi:hypothetical protein
MLSRHPSERHDRADGLPSRIIAAQHPRAPLHRMSKRPPAPKTGWTLASSRRQGKAARTTASGGRLRRWGRPQGEASGMERVEQRQDAEIAEHLSRYPLLDALVERRSRRFGKGMRLNGGPLAYGSHAAPQPLSLAEEAPWPLPPAASPAMRWRNCLTRPATFPRRGAATS